MASSALFDLARIQRVGLRPFVSLTVEAFDVRLELPAIDPPDTPTPDLDRGELTRPHQRINLGDAHVEVVGHIFERHEPRFGAESLRAGGGCVVHVEPQDSSMSPRILDFDSVCSHLVPLAWGHGIPGV